MGSAAGRGATVSVLLSIDRTVERAIDRPTCSWVDGLFCPLDELRVEVELGVSRTVTARVVVGENSGESWVGFVFEGSRS